MAYLVMRRASFSSRVSSKVYIVIPAFNRREITKQCLRLFSGQGVFEWATVVVVDDGSTDGTSEMIEKNFPDVTILKGDGTLWWSGGIKLGMQFAYDNGADFIFWFNDDCYIERDVFPRLIEVSEQMGSITLAQAVTPSGDIYGGHRRTFLGTKFVSCNENEIKACDVINGNCVCIPRAVIEKVGYPDTKHFPQYRGDSDYSLRAKKAGLDSYIVGDVVCRNEDNWYAERSVMWLLEDVPMRVRWRSFMSLRNGSHVGTHFWWCFKYWPHVALFKFAKPYVKYFCFCMMKLLVPRSLLLSTIGKRSEVWRSYQKHGAKS